MPETRKLGAILAADVAGYSKLTAADEERTLARLRALRSDLIDPTIAVADLFDMQDEIVARLANQFGGAADCCRGGSLGTSAAGSAYRYASLRPRPHRPITDH